MKKKQTSKQATSVWVHTRVTQEMLREIENIATAEVRNLSNTIRVLLQEALLARKGGKA